MALFFQLVAASVRGQARYPVSALMLTLSQFLVTGIEVIAVRSVRRRAGLALR